MDNPSNYLWNLPVGIILRPSDLHALYPNFTISTLDTMILDQVNAKSLVPVFKHIDRLEDDWTEDLMDLLDEKNPRNILVAFKRI